MQLVAYSLFLSKLDITSRFSNFTKSLDFVPKQFSAKICNIVARHTMTKFTLFEEISVATIIFINKKAVIYARVHIKLEETLETLDLNPVGSNCIDLILMEIK